MEGTVASLASQVGTWGLPEQFLRSNAEGEALPFQHRSASILSHILRRGRARHILKGFMRAGVSVQATLAHWLGFQASEPDPAGAM